MKTRINRNVSFTLVAIALIGLLPSTFTATDSQSSQSANETMLSIENKTEGMRKMDGFFPMYWDEKNGKVWLEISRFDTEILYVRGLSAGLGSNDIGLDRGQSGGTRIVSFQRIGPKILMIQPNYRYRATSANPDEQRAVEEGFAKSVLFGFEVSAETEGRALVDTTKFLIRDAHNVIGRLQQREKVTYKLDASRSAVYLPNTKGFPKNTEMDVLLTYTSDRPSSLVGTVTPTSNALTLRQHHSLVELPGPGFESRPADPRSGVGSITYLDYSAALGEPMTKRFARRHRLKKKDPTAEVSEPVEPIIYYLDRGVPEPVRSALIDGAQWWNQAFAAAGYRDAFQVQIMPESADKMDVRYNVINWVHRSTRGWSSGGSVTDPRTGEIIRGQVTLGSLRVRQDYLIGEGLLSPYENGSEAPAELVGLALARIRQLSAHEVGHTLGFGHNYYASPLGRISVLDYPHPLITLRSDGTLDMTKAYDVGIGEWDKVFVRWAYQEFPEGTNKKTALDQILTDARESGMIYMTNQDVQINPFVHQWANGQDVAIELERMMMVRRVALDRFDERSIKTGMPWATMEEALVPLYLHHRYQIEAAASGLGGISHTYALRGDGQIPMHRIPGIEQRRIMTALLKTLNPVELALPDSVLKHLSPRPSGYRTHRELFPRNTGMLFDALSPALTLAQIAISNILEPERAARLVQQHALDSTLPGLNEVIDGLLTSTFLIKPSSDYESEIKRTVEGVVVEQLKDLASHAGMGQVRAIANYQLKEIRKTFSSETRTWENTAERAHYELLGSRIDQFLSRPNAPFIEPTTLTAPPGAPIGDSGLDWLDTIAPWCSEWSN